MKQIKKQINKLLKEKLLKENINNLVNKGSDAKARLVEIKYNNKWLPAIEIGYAAGPFFQMDYILLDDVRLNFHDFKDGHNYDEIVKELNPINLLLK